MSGGGDLDTWCILPPAAERRKGGVTGTSFSPVPKLMSNSSCGGQGRAGPAGGSSNPSKSSAAGGGGMGRTSNAGAAGEGHVPFVVLALSIRLCVR